jgi:chaperone modulatory protein CbpM
MPENDYRSIRALVRVHALTVEDGEPFTLLQLSHICRTDSGRLIALVQEGVLTPAGDDPPSWRFDGASLRRARTALRLTRDLELSAAGAALVLDLLGEIEALRSQLRRHRQV